MARKKLLIFDLGGVVLDLYVERSFSALVALGLDPAMLTEKGCLMNNMIQRFDRGDIDAGSFFSYIEAELPGEVCARCGGGLRGRVADMWNMMLGALPQEKLQIIKELREKGYRVVMLSNTNEGHWPLIEKLFLDATGIVPEVFFDALYLSFRMHLRKPDPAIFGELLHSEGVEPGDCLFFDDSAENCEAARRLSIETVLLQRNAPWDGIFTDY